MLKAIRTRPVRFLLKTLCDTTQPFASTTFKQQGKAGVEPDACFYIQNYQRMIGRRLQPDDPPPDLAIENVTSKTTLDAYEIIGVPELWIYDSGKLTIYILQEGKYIESPTSPIFGEIEVTQIIPSVVERAWQVGSVQALEELEALLKASH